LAIAARQSQLLTRAAVVPCTDEAEALQVRTPVRNADAGRLSGLPAYRRDHAVRIL
jgi:hypothetical protein